MGRQQRRRLTDEVKAEVAGLVRSGRTVAGVSRDLDLTESAVRTRCIGPRSGSAASAWRCGRS